METLLTCTLALLEMTFVFVGLLLLHSLRKIIFGNAAFYMAIGLLLIFTQFVNATELKVVLGFDGADFYVAPSILFLPYLAIILIVYVTEGTIATQRLILGAMITLGFYVYLSHLTIIQCDWGGYSISQGPSADSFEYLLKNSQRALASSILAQTLDFFMIPIFFQRLRNLQCRLFICVVGALMLTQLVDTFVFVTACFWGQPQWWLHIKSSYIVKAFSTVCLSTIATVYLSRIEREKPGLERGTLDILLSFLGSYGRTQALQKNLQEWEGRYRLVIENASDMIILVSREGKILDANLAAVRIFEFPSKENLVGKNFRTLLVDTEEFQFDMETLWENLAGDLDEENERIQNQSQRTELRAMSNLGKKIELDMTMNLIDMENIPVLILFGRDVTEENRFNREREDLKEQLSHAQRLESVGKLAGGVAHDFNNYLHSIQGNLDILLDMYDISDEKIVKHLRRINDLTEQSAKLTQQLLGFARKGKYRVEVLDLCGLMRETVDLFSPQSQKNIDFTVDIGNEKMPVKGDAVQLKQVFLNILINARDAIEHKEESEAIMRLCVKNASIYENAFNMASAGKEGFSPEKFCCVMIEDNGIGMDRDIIGRIFDPFFTTKPVGKGTGMGLAMVYGAITNHHGLIHVESKKGEGSKFYIFLPGVLNLKYVE